MKTVAILLCGGSSNRMQGITEDKVLTKILGKTSAEHSLRAFEASGVVDSYVVVFRKGAQLAQLKKLLPPLTSKEIRWTEGGSERQQSVHNALQSSPDTTDIVLIHDCARPLIHPESISRVHEAAVKDKVAVLGHRVVDTIKQVPATATSPRQTELRDLDRNRLWAMETPQAFSFRLIKMCYEKITEEGHRITDDTAAASKYDYRVTVVENHHPNPKITHPEDLALAELLLQQRDTDR